MQIKPLTPSDLVSVLENLSDEGKSDIEAFNNSKESLIDAVLDAYPFAWSIYSGDKAECVCWYNVGGKVGYTSMLYSINFLKNKGITPVIKKLVDENSIIAKDRGLEAFELHSTLFHPLSETWYQRLGFNKTNKTYLIGDKTISIFERRL